MLKLGTGGVRVERSRWAVGDLLDDGRCMFPVEAEVGDDQKLQFKQDFFADLFLVLRLRFAGHQHEEILLGFAVWFSAVLSKIAFCCVANLVAYFRSAIQPQLPH